jgi:hypothetical protein
MEAKEFKKRVIGKDYITKYISRDFKESNTKRKDKLLKELAKIYPNKKILKAILTILGSALTGLAVRDSYLMFLIGKSSAGKSTILDLTKYATEIYVKQIKPDTFVEGKNTDKIVNTYEKALYIRLTWLNEPKDRKFDSAFIKSWADGECNAEKLYQEGSHDFRHFSLTIFTANNMPNIQVSEGVQRRMRAYEHKSKFTENENEVDEINNIYLADKDFKSIFEHSDKDKNAFVEILVEYAYKWLQTKKLELPEEFSECTNTILDMNDHIQDFIDGKLTITKNDENRIGKQQMLKLFTTACPNRHLTELQLISELKNRGVIYDRKKRFNNVQGCFIGVEQKGIHDDDEDNINLEEYKYMKNKVKESDQKLLFMYELLKKHNIKIDDKSINDYVKDKEVEEVKQMEEIKEVEKPKESPASAKLHTQVCGLPFNNLKKSDIDEDSEDEKPKKIKVIKEVTKKVKKDESVDFVKCSDNINPFI